MERRDNLRDARDIGEELSQDAQLLLFFIEKMLIILEIAESSKIMLREQYFI